MTIARVAETFHVLPSQVARALDDDPEQLDIVCMGLLGYASVKAQFDQAGNDDSSIKHLEDHPFMLAVRKNTFDLHMERVAEFRKRQAAPLPDNRREQQAIAPDANEKKRGPLKRERTNGR